MKKLVFFTLICSITFGLLALKPSHYEDYIIIKYLINLGELDNARTVIDKYLKTSPDDPFILTEKAFVLKNLKNDRTEALKILSRAAEIYPEYYYANYLRASFLLSEYFGDQTQKELLHKGVEYLKTAIKDNPDHYDSYYLLGVLLNETGKHKESNSYFEKLNRMEENPGAYFYMAYNHHQLGNEDAEIKAYKKLLEFDPGDPRVLKILGQLYFKKREFEKAAKYLEQLFQQAPEDKQTAMEYLYSLFFSGDTKTFLEVSKQVDISDSPMMLYFTAAVLSRAQKFDQAEKLLAKIDKKDFRAHLLKADIAIRKSNYFQAYQALKKVGDAHKNNVYYSLFFDTAARLGLNRKALEVFEEIRDNKNLIQAFTINDCFNIIICHTGLGKTENLIETVQLFREQLKERALGLGEFSRILKDIEEGKKIKAAHIEHGANFFLISQVLKSKKQYNRALALAKERVDQSGEEADVMELVDIYFQQEKYVTAENIIKKQLKMNPKSVETANFYAYILAVQGKNLDQALKISAIAVKSEPDSPAYLDTYGYILFKMGRVKEAEEYLRKAYDREPLEKDIIEHLAECYSHSGKDKEIIPLYKKALAEDVDFKDKLEKKLKEVQKKVNETKVENIN